MANSPSNLSAKYLNVAPSSGGLVKEKSSTAHPEVFLFLFYGYFYSSPEIVAGGKYCKQVNVENFYINIDVCIITALAKICS